MPDQVSNMDDRFNQLAIAVGITVVSVFVVIILSTMLLYPEGSNDTHPRIERCSEDVVLVGIGDYEDGHYSHYICGPALDDFGG